MANEKRLIYLEDAKEALTGWETDPTDEEIKYTLDNLLTGEAVEVAHGRWNRVEVELDRGVKTHRFACSVCGFLKNTLIGNYCPNCGADMRDSDGNG